MSVNADMQSYLENQLDSTSTHKQLHYYKQIITYFSLPIIIISPYLLIGNVWSVRMRLSLYNIQPLQFTLICSSAFGPATTVTWTRDSEEIEGGTSLLINPLTPTYRHILNATEEGVYTCTVSNNLPSTAAATINMISMF